MIAMPANIGFDFQIIITMFTCQGSVKAGIELGLEGKATSGKVMRLLLAPMRHGQLIN